MIYYPPLKVRENVYPWSLWPWTLIVVLLVGSLNAEATWFFSDWFEFHQFSPRDMLDPVWKTDATARYGLLISGLVEEKEWGNWFPALSEKPKTLGRNFFLSMAIQLSKMEIATTLI
jgi:hypothetical protein